MALKVTMTDQYMVKMDKIEPDTVFMSVTCVVCKETSMIKTNSPFVKMVNELAHIMHEMRQHECMPCLE